MPKKNKKVPIEKAEGVVVDVCRTLVGYQRIKVCGSIRRKERMVGDIDIVVSPADGDSSYLIKSIHEDINAVQFLAEEPKIQRTFVKDVQVDFYICPDRLFGSHVLLLTGSMWFNIKCRTIAKEMGYRLSQYGLLTGDGEEIAITENDILETLGLEQFLNPVLR